MSFWDMVEEEGYKALDKYYKRMKELIRTKSDAEIEHAYRNRYNNPKITSRGIKILEEEAARRGII